MAMLNNQMVYFVVYMCLFCHVHTFDLVTPFQAGEHEPSPEFADSGVLKSNGWMACLWECAAG